MQVQSLLTDLPGQAEGLGIQVKSAWESTSSPEASSCVTRAETLGEGEEEASCDTEGLRMTRRMTSEPPLLSQPGDAGG